MTEEDTDEEYQRLLFEHPAGATAVNITDYHELGTGEWYFTLASGEKLTLAPGLDWAIGSEETVEALHDS